MMRYYSLLLLVVFLLSCDSENGNESSTENYFVKFYGEDGNHEGVDFVANSDGSFILLGNQKVVGDPLGQQIFVVKVDASGMVINQASFGQAGNDFARDIELTPDGNIIIAAETQKGPDDKDVYLLVVSQDLNTVLKSKQVGLKKTDGQEADEEVNSITLVQGGYIVSGSTTAVKILNKPNDTKDVLHLRFTTALDLVDTGQWTYTQTNDDSEDVLVKMFEINSSTYYGFGYTNKPVDINSSRDFKYWIFRTGATGVPSGDEDLLGILGSSSEDEKLSDVIVNPLQAGDGYVLSGVKTSASGESQPFIVKLPKNPFATGDVVQKSIPSARQGNVENFLDVDQEVVKRTRMIALSQGGYLLLNNSKTAAGDDLNISLLKLSNSFVEEWQVPVYFGGAGNDFNGSINELADGKIIVMGTMTLGGITGQTKMVLMKLNPEGRFVP